MTPSTRATCKFCGTVALPNDEQNCSSLDGAYRQTPARPYGCPWFDKDARKANPAPTPSTPASTDAGALAAEPSELLTNIRTASEIEQERLARKAALRKSAPQETRGDEPESVSHYVENYRFEFEDGRSYTPNEQDKALLEDAIEGWRALAASQQSPRLEREELMRRRALRQLVDIVWQHATESAAVPSTKTADMLIDKSPVSSTLHPEQQRIADELNAKQALVSSKNRGAE